MAIFYAPGQFLGHSGELCGAEITGPKTFSGTFAATKIITGTVLTFANCVCVQLSHGEDVQCVTLSSKNSVLIWRSI